MHFHVLTLFPEMVSQGLSESILGRAAKKGCIELETVNIRDYTENKHKKVDDYPYGGGAGMLMQAQPVYDACAAVKERIAMRRAKEGSPIPDAAGEKGELPRLRVIYVTPQGTVFTQQMAEKLAREEDLIFLCGHYEGIDERVLEEVVTDYVSIGDYVLTGGELPAMVMIDAVSRMVPGVLKNEESAETESFQDGLLEYPQYTRPEIWHDRPVPPVLLSGDHSKVEKWRLEQSEERTRQRRPELYEAYSRTDRAVSYLSKDRLSHMDMLEVIRRGQADVIRAEESGVLLHDRPSGAWMLSASDEDMGERLLSEIPREEKDLLFLVHQDFLRDSIARRFHQRSVERAGHLQRHTALCTCFFGVHTGRVHCGAVARNCHLTGAVKICNFHNAFTACFFASSFQRITLQPEHSRHAARAPFGGLHHRFAAKGHQRNRLLCVKHTGGMKGGIFAQAQTRCALHLQPCFAQHCRYPRGKRHHARLGKLRLAELFVRAFKAKLL